MFCSYIFLALIWLHQHYISSLPPHGHPNNFEVRLQKNSTISKISTSFLGDVEEYDFLDRSSWYTDLMAHLYQYQAQIYYARNTWAYLLPSLAFAPDSVLLMHTRHVVKVHSPSNTWSHISLDVTHITKNSSRTLEWNKMM